MADAPNLNGSGSSRKSRYWHKYITLLQQDTRGFPGVCTSGKWANQQGSCNAKAGSLGKMGASSGRQGLIDCPVEGCAPAHQILYPGCLRCSTKAIQFVLLGESGVRSLPAVLRDRDSWSHPQLLFESPGCGMLPLAPWPILKANANTMCSGISHSNCLHPEKKTIAFVRADGKTWQQHSFQPASNGTRLVTES